MRRMVAKREACRAILLFIKPYARKHRLFRTQQKKPVQQAFDIGLVIRALPIGFPVSMALQ